MSTKENDNGEESKEPDYNDDKDKRRKLENQNKRQQIVIF
jgi:hypothetical protein